MRELNLYPLWKLREGNGGAIGPAERSVSLRTETASAPLGHPAASPLRGLRGEVAPDEEIRHALSPLPSPLPQAGEGDKGSLREYHDNKSREQLIGELGWPELKAMVRDCTACRLRAGCTQTVFGVGDEKASWLFVGEGPGADEDARGEPFVGQAGRLLDNMLMAIKLKRGKDVYIGNVVKCMPPDDRTPKADEIATCLPYLQRQIELIRPKVIVALGKTAANTLLGMDATLASLRGKVHDYRGIPLIVTYHPAYLLRMPEDKARAWEDLCLAAKTMEG